MDRKKRPDDTNANAVLVAKIAIGESEEKPARTSVLRVRKREVAVREGSGVEPQR